MKSTKSEILLNRLYGSSMFPTLQDSDKVVVKGVPFQDLRLRDIIVFKQGPQSICHRIVKIGRKYTYVYTKGDFNFRGFELVKEEILIGKVVAVVSGNRICPLRFRKTILYYLLIRLLSYLKDWVMFFVDSLYGFSIFRKFLKRISASGIRCCLAKEEKEIRAFNSFYNFFPNEIASFVPFLRISGFYKHRLAGKLLVLKGREDSTFWLWGPYIRLFYRARGLGTKLLKEAFKVVPSLNSGLILSGPSTRFARSGSSRAKSRDEVEGLIFYALVPSQKSILRFYEDIGFKKERYLRGSHFWILRRVFPAYRQAGKKVLCKKF